MTKTEKLKLQQHQIKSLCEENKSLRMAYEAETASTIETMKRILALESEVNLWRNRHSEAFMECEKLKDEVDTWSHRALDEQRYGAAVASEIRESIWHNENSPSVGATETKI